MKFVKVEWVDSYVSYGWHDKGCPHTSSDCVTVGILVEENDKDISIALSESLNNWGDVIVIPKCSVKRTSYLLEEVGKYRKPTPEDL